MQCASAVEELNQQIGELYKTNFDLVQADYENQLSLIEHEMNMINADISMAQAKGMLDSAGFYERLAAHEAESIGKLKSELSDLERYFKEAMDSGQIAEGSEEWYAMKQEILGVKEAIAQANVQMQEYSNTIRDIKWSYFDYAQEQFNLLAQETSFLIELMSNKKLFDDRGQFSNAGYATVGMRSVNYDAHMKQADEYAKEMQKIQDEMLADPYNTELIDRRNTLLQLQRESILAAEQEKVAVKSLVEEGIRIELDSLRELIDAYKDRLDAEKDLYDYQKKISDKSKNISSIQKQLTAYQNDTSEETRAKIQKLNQELEKARTDLQETERDKSISEQKKILDDVYDEYESLLNERLDDIDRLMSEMIACSNANADRIQNEIARAADQVGYTVTESLQMVMGGRYAYYDHSAADGSGIDTSGASSLMDRIYSDVNRMAVEAGTVSAYVKGTPSPIGSISNDADEFISPDVIIEEVPEEVVEDFMQAAQAMHAMADLVPSSTQGFGLIEGSGSVGDITMNISIDHVQDYNDFVTQLQGDPKFEKLIDTMTINKILGGSRLAKNGIRF